jgi:hypothetical protein
MAFPILETGVWKLKMVFPIMEADYSTYFFIFEGTSVIII